MKWVLLFLFILIITGCDTASENFKKYRYTIYIPDINACYTDSYDIEDGVISLVCDSSFNDRLHIVKSNVWTVKDNIDES